MDRVWIVTKNRTEFYKVCANEETADFYVETLNAEDAFNYYSCHEELVRSFSDSFLSRTRGE